MEQGRPEPNPSSTNASLQGPLQGQDRTHGPAESELYRTSRPWPAEPSAQLVWFPAMTASKADSSPTTSSPCPGRHRRQSPLPSAFTLQRMIGHQSTRKERSFSSAELCWNSTDFYFRTKSKIQKYSNLQSDPCLEEWHAYPRAGSPRPLAKGFMRVLAHHAPVLAKGFTCVRAHHAPVLAKERHASACAGSPRPCPG